MTALRSRVIHGDGIAFLESIDPGSVHLMISDNPYGIGIAKWDDPTTALGDYHRLAAAASRALAPGGALYLFGGIGKPCNRVFFRFLSEVEERTPLQLSTLITWKKRRAYGIRWGYLFCREEIAYFVNGDPRRPRVFNVPYLDQQRGYPGYNAKYPARDSRLRRSNVWTDITEILREKRHVAEKPRKLIDVIVSTSSNPGDLVVDPMAGSGATGESCLALGRNFVMIESDRTDADSIATRLSLPLAKE